VTGPPGGPSAGGALTSGSSPTHAAETAVLLAVAAAYAAWASTTSPFTVPADVAVSVPSAAFAAVLVLQRRWPSGPWRRLTPARPARDGSAVAWVAVIGLLVAIELASYFHGGPRSAYPTISSAQDALFHSQAARASAWLLWLVVGWFLARR
jgi:hypothetical protein